MSKVVNRKSKRGQRAAGPKFVLVKRTDRAWLLAGTSLFAGVIGLGLAGAPTLAVAADCTNDPNLWSCSGPGVVPLDPLFAGGEFLLNLDGSPIALELNVNSATPGVTLYANGEDGQVRVEEQAYVRNAGGDGMYAEDVGDVEFDIDGELTGYGSEDADGLHIVGYSEDSGEIGIFVHEGGSLNGIASMDPSEEGDLGGFGLHVDGQGAFVYGRNNGHIAGGTAGALFTNTSGVDFGNHSYDSMIGAYGIIFDNNVGPVQYSNGSGLTVGLLFDGVYVENVDNSTENNAVQINNNQTGVIVGYENGIHIVGDVEASDGGNPDIQINNDAFYSLDDEDDNEETPRVLNRNEGGFIYGYDGVGVLVESDDGEIAGDVRVNNTGTLGRFFDPAELSEEWDISDFGGSSEDFAAFEGMVPYGIYGYEAGVAVYDVDGNVDINNGSRSASVWDDQLPNEDMGYGVDVPLPSEPWFSGGAIVGFGGYGVYLEGVGDGSEETGYVNINNGNDDNFDMRGGLIVGYGEDGVYVDDAYDVNINNAMGVIHGSDDGIYLDDIGDDDSGRVNVYNASGSITAWGGIGVDVSATNADRVEISNMRWDGEPMHGGVILGDDQAIRIEANDIWIGNGPGGAILGSGSWDFEEGEGEAVIDLYSDGDNADGSVDVQNFGLIASWDTLSEDTAHVDWYEEYDAWMEDGAAFYDLGYEIDLAAIESDVETFGAFAWSGGQESALDNLDTSLSDYANSASALAISSQGFDFEELGLDAHVNNYGGIIMGRIGLYGGDSEESTSVQNRGVWYVKDLEGSEEGEWQSAAWLGGDGDFNGIDNAGLVQTAFDSEDYDTATFFVSDFHNGIYYDDGPVSSNGLVSLIDGGTGDQFVVDVTQLYDISEEGGNYGNRGFHGSFDGDLTSFVGMDLDLSTTSEDAPWLRSDFMSVYGDIDGTTGIIFNVLAGGTTEVFDTIQVAYVEGWDQNEDGTCFDVACVEGDTMYISDRSMNYQEVDGIGTIQDGFYSWYLTEVPNFEMPDPSFLLVSTFSPNAVQLPSLITGAQNIWHDTAGVVADHVYGGHFPLDGEGGAGADLPVGMDPIAPVASPNFAVWGKASGSWTQQDDTVTQTVNNQTINIDTSFLQDTFSLLAGADYSSNPGGDGFRAGVFGGAVGSSLDFDSYNASATYTGGVIGAYGALTYGGFYADAEAKADFLTMDYNALNIEAQANVTSVGVLANTGYRMEMGGFFLEPNGSVAFVNTSIDDISAGGASVAFSNGDSLQAGAGVKLGTTVETESLTAELAVSAKIWNEFEDANEVTVSDGLGTDVPFSDDISGAFAELRATATAYTDDRSLSGFGTVGTKFNEDFASVDAKVGVRKGF